LKWVRFHAEARKENENAVTPTPNGFDTEAAEEESDLLNETEEDHYKVGLLKKLQSVTPEGFERICALLLRKSDFEKIKVTGRPKDGGIDGIGILEINAFVSMKVLFQCKRYKGTVSRAQVGDFRNAMMGRAEKGIIMTTGIFSKDAWQEAERVADYPIELVDGDKLVEMFIAVELGVRPKTVYEVENSFFAEYMPNETTGEFNADQKTSPTHR
jgi:restriction system protein